MQKEIKQLKTRKFWLNILKYVIAWITPRFKKWVQQEIDTIKQRLAIIDL